MKGFTFFYFLLIFLTITGCGGSDSTSTSDKENSNSSPQIISKQAQKILEGHRTIVTLQAIDKDNDSFQFSLLGGPDKEHFTLDALGQLAFNVLPDYEAPLDANQDNKYEVTLRVSDGELSNDSNFEIQVINAIEGRVIYGPSVQAEVFIDCDGNGVKGENEPLTITDEAGYYAVALPERCDNMILVSKGGSKNTTGRQTSMMLTAKVPTNYNMSENIVLTPVSTVITFTDEKDHSSLLDKLGISSISSSTELLKIDPWQRNKSSKVTAQTNVQTKASYGDISDDVIKIQKVNVLIGTVIKTADSLDGNNQSTEAARAIADLASQEKRVIDLGNTVTLGNILDAAVDAKVPDVVLETVATVNTVFAIQDDPTSDKAIEIISNSQEKLQENVAKLVDDQITEEQFRQNSADVLTTIIKAPIATPNKMEVPEQSKVLIALKGNNSDGTLAMKFQVDDIPSHGTLEDINGIIIKSEDLPYSMPNDQLFYTSASGISRDSFLFSVCDGDLKSALASVDIVISNINDRPIAKNAVLTFLKGDAKSVLLEGSDEDGDNLIYKITDLPEFGKLMDGDKELKPYDLDYQLSGNNNQITYVSSENGADKDFFYFVSNDGQVNSKKAKVTLNIEGTNQIPIIEGHQALSIPEDNSFEITLDHLNVSDNDNVYPDDFALEISDGTNYSVIGTTIKPRSNFVGTISVPATVSDGTHSSEIFELTVIVSATDDAPILNPIDPINFDEDGSAQIQLQGKDIDSDDLTYQVFGGSDTTVKARLENQTVTLQPATNYHGSQTFIATLTAGGKTASQSFTVTVNPQNDLPILTGNPKTNISQGESYNFKPNAHDDDGNKLSFGIENQPIWTSFDPETGELSGKPTNADVGITKGVKITVTDKIAEPVTLPSFDIEVINENDRPSLLQINDLSFDEDHVKIITVEGFDIDAEDQLIFTISGGSPETVFALPGARTSGHVTTKRAYIFDSADNYHGSVEFTAMVTDDKGLSASQSFTVSVDALNDAPIVKEIDQLIADEQTLYTYQVKVEDPDDVNNGTDLAWSLSNAPDGMSISSQGKIQWIPEEGVSTSGPVTLTVEDGGEDGAGEVEQNFTLEVIQQDDMGSIAIYGNPVSGRTLTALVTDDDGIDDENIDFTWWRYKNGARFAIGTRDSYALTDEDIDAKISVIADYRDNQNFSNELTATIDTPVISTPVTKKTIAINNASAGMTIFEKFQIKNRLNIDDLSNHSLKELSIDKLIQIAENSLPEQASDQSSDRHPIYSYEQIEGMYPFLTQSSLFEITANGEIILSMVPELSNAYVGTGEDKVTVGRSHTLALFNDNAELQGLINIRFSPSSVADNICMNEVGKNQLKPPVVLVHGWMGFDSASLIDFGYWNKIEPELAETDAQIFSAKVDPWASPETRGEQLIAYIECVLLTTEKDRVDIFGHSLGSATSRYAAYWLDQHDGHVPKNATRSEIRSLTSVNGINYGGNLHVESKSHKQRLLMNAENLYKGSILLRDFEPIDLLYKLINLEDLSNSNSYMGKQYELVSNLFQELVKNGGMLDVTHKALLASEETLNNLAGNGGLIKKWLDVKTSVDEWLAVGKGLFEVDIFNWSGFWIEHPDRSHVGLAVDYLYRGLTKLNNASNNFSNQLGRTVPEISIIRSSLNSINNELQKLSNENENPDDYVLASSMDNMRHAINSLVSVLPAARDMLRHQFIPGLHDLDSAFHEYLVFMDKRWDWLRIDWGWFSFNLDRVFDWIGEGVTDLETNDVRNLKHIVLSFKAVLEHDLLPLLDEFSGLNIEDLSKALASENQADRNPAITKIVGLINRTNHLLDTFPKLVNSHKQTLSGLNPGWGDMTSSLAPLSSALDRIGIMMSDVNSSITTINIALKVAMGQYDADWHELLSWEMSQIHGIKANIIVRLLETDTAASYGLNLTRLNECVLKNNHLHAYLQNQKDNRAGRSDYPIALPTSSEISPGEDGCAMFIGNIFNAFVDHFIQMDEINPESGKQRVDDFSEGMYAVSGFGAQMFNLKYPDTGITSSRYKNCLDDHDFSNVGYENLNRSTKYYSLIGNRIRDPENFSDRAQVNMIVVANNTSVEERISNFLELFSSLALTDRSGLSNPSGDMTPDQIDELFENTDIIVPTCSQELGEVINYNGSFTQNLNHSQSVGHGAYPLFLSELFELFSGKQVEGYAAIHGELDQCNESASITDRKNCSSELFVRVAIMYATGKVIDGLYPHNGTIRLDIFDLIKSFLSKDVEMEGVDHIVVPEMYKQHLQSIQN